jgi:nickel/cobalt exporter
MGKVMNRKWRRFRLSIIALLGALLLDIAFATPSHAHWADLAVAEIVVGEKQTQITLTFPTGLVTSADDNKDGQLTPNEVSSHQAELQGFLGDRIRLTDANNRNGTLTVKASDASALPPNLKVTAGTHSTLVLLYTWQLPVKGLKIHYDLFLPGVPTARCLATIFHNGQVQNSIFSPENRDLSLMQNSANLPQGSLLIAIAGSVIWGAMHAMSPGHGKTIVGAYLVGSRATVQHAMFLGLTTTITHTIGVFALGLVTLFASRYILPEQLYPWMSFVSGLIVVIIGLNLLSDRLQSLRLGKKSPLALKVADDDHTHDHSHDHHHHGEHSHTHDRTHDHHHHGEHGHTHDHAQSHTHDHTHDHHDHGEHSHSHHSHSHLPPGADGEPVTWRNLLALGISGGIVPCPSALVLLLSAIAVNRIGFGLTLVLAFSLGLAATLTGIGLLLVGARRIFERMPLQLRVVRGLSALSALLITLLGLGITTQALLQIGIVKL